MTIKKLFGTDGIRGVAGKYPLAASDIVKIGCAAGDVLRKKHGSKRCRVLAVRDTRASGNFILQTLAKGLQKKGVDVVDAGVLSTPSVAHLVRKHGFDSGVVISASHNPPEFNGIKFFTEDGGKWPDAWEESVEKIFASDKKSDSKKIRPGKRTKAVSYWKEYESFLLQTLGPTPDLSSLCVAIDCSNGSNSTVAPHLIKRLKARVHILSCKPNGKNINVNCGSQHTENLARTVIAKKCHLGVAFDGDGDRVILVDEKGNTVDGDQIIALLTQSMKESGQLKNNTTVITVMANFGLRKALQGMGVKAIEVSVGDRYVAEAMKKHKAVLGGEQSGHIILGRHLPTGDGLLTAIHILKLVAERQTPLSELTSVMKRYPQVLLNVPVKEKTPIPELNGLQKKINETEKQLGGNGRVLVRYSGTEPLLRIMLEGPDKKELESLAKSIADEVSGSHGASRH